LALHDVTAERGNVDHVLIGPAGIFTIETRVTEAGSTPTRSTCACSAKPTRRVRRSSASPAYVSNRCCLQQRLPHPAVSRRNGVAILPAGCSPDTSYSAAEHPERARETRSTPASPPPSRIKQRRRSSAPVVATRHLLLFVQSRSLQLDPFLWRGCSCCVRAAVTRGAVPAAVLAPVPQNEPPLGHGVMSGKAPVSNSDQRFAAPARIASSGRGAGAGATCHSVATRGDRSCTVP